MKKILTLFFFALLFTHLSFSQPSTQIGNGAGDYQELFNNLKTLLLQSENLKKIKLGGKERNQFVQWIRDHVHVTKAMKYLVPEVSGFWQYYMETQTAEGMYYDY